MNAEVINNEQDYEEHQYDIESPRAIPGIEQPTDSNGKPLNQRLAYKNLINDEAMLQSNITLQKVKVVGRHVK